MQFSAKSFQHVESSLRPLLEVFVRELDSFVFFHLGSDAEVDIEARSNEVVVAVRHARVRPFRFRLEAVKLAKLVEDPSRIEGFLLDQLTAHRRSES